jgi:hypothetical protein
MTAVNGLPERLVDPGLTRASISTEVAGPRPMLSDRSERRKRLAGIPPGEPVG